jgi:hypothetical protein
VSRVGCRTGLAAVDVPAVPGTRAAALPAGVLHRCADVRAMPRIRSGDFESLSGVPRRRPCAEGTQAHGEDSGRHCHRPAAASVGRG